MREGRRFFDPFFVWKENPPENGGEKKEEY